MRSSLVSLPVLLLVLALLASQAAFAQDESAPGEEGAKRPRFVFDGFGTLGLVHSSEQEADFVTNPVRPDGTGFTREWSGEVDSRLGLQLTAALTKKLTAVVQVIVEQRHDDHYQPTLEWANLKYSFTEDFSVRIGRTALPTFASSDSRKVGYANPWVRPPVELYSLVPIFNSDGVDASYRHRFAGWTHTVQATLGASDVDLPGGGTAEIRELVGLFDTLERGDLTLHGALATARVSIDSASSLFDAFRAFGPEGQSLANRFDVADKRVRFAGLGATYDPGRWFVTAELGRIRTRSLIGDRTAGYVTAGYRVGSFTAYATHSEAAADSPTSSPGLTLSSLPPPLVPPAAALNAALDNVLASIAVQRSLSLGARWDFRKNAALEVQVDRVEVDADSFGTFVNRQPGFERGGEATLFSVATSFVF